VPDLSKFGLTEREKAMQRIAIIGAGLSGLVLSRRLHDVADVTLFEKSRSVGGRIATRYADEYEFDHGAQFFSARTRAFRDFLEPLIQDQVIANWAASFAELDRAGTRDFRSWRDDYPHYVGMPRMNAIGKYLAQGLRVHTDTPVAEIGRSRGKWVLLDASGNSFDGFDWLVLTAPAPQTASLASGFPELVTLCDTRDMHACFALMLGFAKPLELPWQAALVRNADISWVSVNSSKPGRKSPFTLLVHSTNAWADAHVDDEIVGIRERLLDEASAVCGLDLRAADYCNLHRWRFANVDKQRGPRSYVHDDLQLAACGDWFVRGRVESAFTSATALASQLQDRL
jgi:predicted NAD/FAD-dependent oxidoreductase